MFGLFCDTVSIGTCQGDPLGGPGPWALKASMLDFYRLSMTRPVLYFRISLHGARQDLKRCLRDSVVVEWQSCQLLVFYLQEPGSTPGTKNQLYVKFSSYPKDKMVGSPITHERIMNEVSFKLTYLAFTSHNQMSVFTSTRSSKERPGLFSQSEYGDPIGRV